ncbi:hypothetical protein PENANT_c033G00655 [Penicillium antarcticum]|uniref:Wings apart-like protein C-terminal domain-containing protein n=1 Tax=Penicillium antarcticum TaxID=416450 RepID=A0A1V6PUP0_9EURO|nr:uncharacterized protein N7508_000793 [Penicillium antarcticum]KAJ5320510.1 hypothetical protein N7508_000793 [Penicillium antarcticum]OQD80663.1 hypothetical protein PENANT_c033G00655 [Penicillium antarcticum]
MENSRPWNRRPITYGSAARSQTRPDIAKFTRPSPAKRTSKEGPSPSNSRASQLINTKLQRNKNGNKKPAGSTNETNMDALAQSQADQEPDVYDFPSSDEAQNLVGRRKRRRHNTEDKEVPAPLQSTAFNSTTDGRSEVVDSGEGIVSNPAVKNVRDRRRPLIKTHETHFKSSITYSGGNKSILQQTNEISASGNPGFGKLSSRERDLEPTETSKPRRPVPNTHKASAIPTENVTPGRRRLIDSLGITDSPIETSPKSPAESQPTPNRASHNVHVNEVPVNDCQPGTPALVPSHLRGSQITYARQRSFLDDIFMTDELPTTNLIPELETPSKSVQRQLKYDAPPMARLIVADEETNEDGSVRSIHELRQAGGNARYRGAVESIFEDIEDPQNSLSGRCNAFVQLCSKLLDTGARNRFVECNFDKRLVDCLSIELQVVPAILAFCAYALASSDGNLSYVLATAAWPKLLDTSYILLDVHDDISVATKAQAGDLSRPLQKTIQNIVPQVSSVLFPKPALPKLTPCILALYCMKSTISTLQTKGESPSLSTSLLKLLVEMVSSESSRCVSQKTISTETSQFLGLGFSILEASTASSVFKDEHQDQLGSLSSLHSLLYLKSSHADRVSQKIKPLYIRVILNVTNSDILLCDKFANPELVGGLVDVVLANFGDLTEDALGQENNSLDSVILALGALTNLSERSQESRSIFLRPVGSTNSFLDRLLRLFITNVDSISTAHSVLEVHHNVAVGYLAVLLLTLCLDSSARLQIKSSFVPNGLLAVTSTVDEFLQYHQKIEEELYQFPTKGQSASGFLSRLQELVAQVRQVDL